MLDIIKTIDKEIEDHLTAKKSKGRRTSPGGLRYTKDRIIYSMFFDEEAAQDLADFKSSVASVDSADSAMLSMGLKLKLSFPTPNNLNLFINRFKSELKVIKLNNPDFEMDIRNSVDLRLGNNRTKLFVSQYFSSLDREIITEIREVERPLGLLKPLVDLEEILSTSFVATFLYEESGR